MARKPSEKEPVDPRSTQRKRARKTLFYWKVDYICGAPHYRKGSNHCGRSPKELPKDAPQDLELASKEKQFVSVTLQANHISKDIMDNDLANLEWLCPSCHKLEDSKTEKGVSQVENNFGYIL